MYKTAALIVLASLTGCATTYPQPAELTNVELCEAFFYAAEPYAAAAGEEATRRGVRCPDYRDAVAQERRARGAASSQATLDWLQRNPIAPRPVTCNSVRIGSQVQTVCN